MPLSKERETLVINLVLILLSVGALAVAVWTLITGWLRAGTDDLFLIMVSLLLALLFAINPLMWAHEKGWLRKPSKRKAPEAAATTEKAAATEKAAR
jgi:hypothetical protein